MSFNVKIQIHEAKLEKNTNLFLFMSPWYRITYGSKVIKSEPAYDKHLSPKWPVKSHTLELQENLLDKVLIEVLNEQTVICLLNLEVTPDTDFDYSWQETLTQNYVSSGEVCISIKKVG